LSNPHYSVNNTGRLVRFGNWQGGGLIFPGGHTNIYADLRKIQADLNQVIKSQAIKSQAIKSQAIELRAIELRAAKSAV
jgi:hypothetical protein